jgi:hypothetical protein
VVSSTELYRSWRIGGVTLCAFLVLLCCYAAPATAQESTVPLKPTANRKQLDSRTKVKLVAAVVALAILGFGLVALTYLGGKWTRRIVTEPPADHWEDAATLARDDWAEKPLTPDERRRLFPPVPKL